MKINISKKVIDQIKKDKITPEPEWKFNYKNYSLWFFIILMTLLGALTFSIIFFILFNIDWGIYYFTHNNFFKFLFIILPYFWIVIFIFFMIISIIFHRKTKRGYRYNLLIIFGVILLINILIGLVLYNFGISKKIQHSLENKFPNEERFILPKEGQWRDPIRGLLGGEIVDVINQKEFFIKDHKGNIWGVEIIQISEIDKTITIVKGERVKLIGKKIDNNTFRAFLIKPWNWKPTQEDRQKLKKLKELRKESRDNQIK